MNEDELIAAFQAAKESGDEAAMMQVLMNAPDEMLTAAESESKTSTSGGMTRAGLQGASFGFADEIEGFARSLVGDATYKEERDKIRDYNKEFAEENPGTALAAELAGGFLVPGGIAKGAVGAASKLDKLSTLGKVIPDTTAGKYLGAGLAEGTAAGIGTSEQDGLEILPDAAVGAVLGGGLGFAGGKVSDLITGSSRKEGAELMRQSMGNRTVEELGAEMEELGPQAILPDVSESMRNSTYAALQAAPAGPRDEFSEFILGRGQQSAGRVEDALADVLGTTPAEMPTRKSAGEALAELRSREAREFYGEVEDQAALSPVQVSDRQRDMIRADPEGRRAAQSMLRSFRREAGNPDLELEDVEQSFRFWHGVQSRLRESGEKMGTPNRPGSNRAEGQDVLNMRQSLMEELQDESRNPWGGKYRDATNAFRVRSETIDALRQGEKFDKIPTNDLKQMVNGLSEDDRSALATGVVSDLVNMIRMAPDSADVAKKAIRTPQMRENLRILLGNRAADRLVKKLKDESLVKQTEYHLMGGSQTGNRMAAMQRAGETSAADVATDLATGNVPGLFGKVRNILVGPPGPNTLDQGAAENVLDIMSIQDPQQMMDALGSLESARFQFQDPIGMGLANAPLVPMLQEE